MSLQYHEVLNPTSRITNHDDLVEAVRLANKTQLLLRCLGGLLPGAKPQCLEQVRAVLDVGCGPGVWALELARMYPQMYVIGVDPSSTMIAYASNMLKEQAIENVMYQTIPICVGPFPFPEGSFDLVNAQFMSKFLAVDDWPKFLASCRRLLRPGGLICLTEYELSLTNSPAQEELNRLFVRAMRQAGLSPSVSDRHLGLFCELEPMLYNAGFQECSVLSSYINHSFGVSIHEEWKRDYLLLSRQVLPFIVKCGVATQEQINTLYDQQSIEMNIPTFHALQPFITIWGQVSS